MTAFLCLILSRNAFDSLILVLPYPTLFIQFRSITLTLSRLTINDLCTLIKAESGSASSRLLMLISERMAFFSGNIYFHIILKAFDVFYISKRNTEQAVFASYQQMTAFLHAAFGRGQLTKDTGRRLKKFLVADRLEQVVEGVEPETFDSMIGICSCKHNSNVFRYKSSQLHTAQTWHFNIKIYQSLSRHRSIFQGLLQRCAPHRQDAERASAPRKSESMLRQGVHRRQRVSLS